MSLLEKHLPNAITPIQVGDKTDFLVVPDYDPKITKLFKRMNWNCIEKTIEFKIQESDQFDGYRWIDKMSSSYEESQSDTFKQRKNNITIIFFNQNDEEVAGFKFLNLCPKDHLFKGRVYDEEMDGYEEDDGEDEGIFHQVTFSYEKVENLFYREKSEDELSVEVDPGKRIDKEWKIRD